MKLKKWIKKVILFLYAIMRKVLPVNKKIILFATSGGSKFGKTVEDLRVSVSDSTKIIEGGILNGSPSVEQLKSWAEKFCK